MSFANWQPVQTHCGLLTPHGVIKLGQHFQNKSRLISSEVLYTIEGNLTWNFQDMYLKYEFENERHTCQGPIR